MNSRRAFLTGLSLALASCELEKDRFGRTAEPGSFPEPVTLKEVSFHVRMALPEAELIAEATRRGLALDGDPKQALASLNAPPGLIAKLATREILLTKAELQLYEKRLGARGANRAADEANARGRIDQHQATVNQSLAEQQRTRIRQRQAELAGEAEKIRREQMKERFSQSSDSPYQRRQAEIDAINREIATLSERMP